MFVNSDFSDLLRIFNANHVRYLVIGGYAVVQYFDYLQASIGTLAGFAGCRLSRAKLAAQTSEVFKASEVFTKRQVCTPAICPLVNHQV